jgi:hypothetical protein
MTPKDKAIELVFKKFGCSKQFALIAVDELIKETSFEVPNIRQRYYQEVKQEIEKL